MVNALNMVDPSWSIYGQIVENVKRVLTTCSSWQVCHTKKEANYAAHGLAKATRFSRVDFQPERILVPCKGSGQTMHGSGLDRLHSRGYPEYCIVRFPFFKF
jgi:hypothetical protein